MNPTPEDILTSLRDGLHDIERQALQPPKFYYLPNLADLAPGSYWRQIGCPDAPPGFDPDV